MKWKQWVFAIPFIFSLMISENAAAQVSIGISISARIAPPPLPVYVQPVCPNDGYLWTPGYWAYTDDGYYWVPGVWVLPPQPGYLWTPCYWGYAGGVYGYHPGYWGTHVGFYGGVNYGYGYGGSGFGGGRWEGGSFRYNTAVMNVNRTVVRNTYIDNTVIVHNTTVINNRTSYNGGPGGLAARPSTRDQSAMNEHHFQATSQQTSHMLTAARDRTQFASVNHGKPATTAMNTVGGQRFNQQGHGPDANNTHNQTPSHVASQPHSADPYSAAHSSALPAQQHNMPQQQQHNMPQQQQHNPPQQQQHNPPQQQQHNPPQQQQHNMPQQQHNPQQQQHNPQQQQQHNMPQQQHNMPQQHNPPQPHAGQEPHAAPPQHHDGGKPREH